MSFREHLSGSIPVLKVWRLWTNYLKASRMTDIRKKILRRKEALTLKGGGGLEKKSIPKNDSEFERKGLKK